MSDDRSKPDENPPEKAELPANFVSEIGGSAVNHPVIVPELEADSTWPAMEMEGGDAPPLPRREGEKVDDRKNMETETTSEQGGKKTRNRQSPNK